MLLHVRTRLCVYILACISCCLARLVNKLATGLGYILLALISFFFVLFFIFNGLRGHHLPTPHTPRRL